MFWWQPTRDEINKWVWSKEKGFAERENRSPKLSTEAWLQKHIVTNLHAIFFVTFGNELYDWLSKLTDTSIFKKKRYIVWTLELIHTVKNLDNTITRVVDFWLASVLEGFVTKFAVDQTKSFSEAERYFFKGYRGKYLMSRPCPSTGEEDAMSTSNTTGKNAP